MTGVALARDIIGIRHLSPTGALHVQTVLDRVSPTAVLVEAPSGAEPQMQHLASAATRPPVAIVAFTHGKPLRSLAVPLASYSPEWVACRWALEHDRELAFIDLPADVFLALPDDPAEPGPTPNVLALAAKIAGADDLESWWERSFEHVGDADAWVLAMQALGRELRDVPGRPSARERHDLLRESFMCRRIREVLARGHAPDRIVVVCGAFHASVLVESTPAMDDAAVLALPRCEITLTLMPYSYERLHSRSGYGAGNHAPAYHQMLHKALRERAPDRLAPRFLSRVARRLRKEGMVTSSAQLIDAVRLAHALAALADSPAITLGDLREAAVSCLGGGDRVVVARALDEIETGHAIGQLPPGVSRTALQDDFRRELDALGLARMVADKPVELELDLRENRYVKSESAAFLDRSRSVFLHRLATGGVPLAQQATKARDRERTSWRERWTLRWSPELELTLAEHSLIADSVAGLATHVLSERLHAATDAGSAASVLESAVYCRLADALEDARARLQAVAVEDDSLASVASALGSLLAITRFGGVRAVDPTPLWPLVEQLFLRGMLLVPTAVLCDDVARAPIADALLGLVLAATQEPQRLDAEELATVLRRVALSHAGNPYVAGLTTALLIERMQLDDRQLAESLGRRLSPGEDVELAAGWFEGLTAHNRMALFSRPVVWANLSRFVDALEGHELLRALVPLRRTFGAFSPAEIRRVVSALGEHWSEGAAAVTAAVEVRMSADELAALNQQLGTLDDLDLE